MADDSNSEYSYMINLCWDNHSNVTNSYFCHLLVSGQFSDVILTNGDARLQAHSFMLSMASERFRRILLKENGPNLVIYMGDVAANDLLSALEFIYTGKVRVHRSQLTSLQALSKSWVISALSDALQHLNAGFNDGSMNEQYYRKSPRRNDVNPTSAFNVPPRSFTLQNVHSHAHNDNNETSVINNHIAAENEIGGEDNVLESHDTQVPERNVRGQHVGSQSFVETNSYSKRISVDRNDTPVSVGNGRVNYLESPGFMESNAYSKRATSDRSNQRVLDSSNGNLGNESHYVMRKESSGRRPVEYEGINVSRNDRLRNESDMNSSNFYCTMEGSLEMQMRQSLQHQQQRCTSSADAESPKIWVRSDANWIESPRHNRRVNNFSNQSNVSRENLSLFHEVNNHETDNDCMRGANSTNLHENFEEAGSEKSHLLFFDDEDADINIVGVKKNVKKEPGCEKLTYKRIPRFLGITPKLPPPKQKKKSAKGRKNGRKKFHGTEEGENAERRQRKDTNFSKEQCSNETSSGISLSVREQRGRTRQREFDDPVRDVVYANRNLKQKIKRNFVRR